MPAAGGLTAAELALVVLALRVELRDAVVDGIAVLACNGDLLLFVQTAAGRRALQVAPGGARARLCTTRRRFRREAFETGPRIDRLASDLAGARLLALEQPAGERRCRATWRAGDATELHLEIELFGARGLWCCTRADGVITCLSRLPAVRGRELRPGAIYVPPPARPPGHVDPPPRFCDPVLEAVDAHFTRLDESGEAAALHDELRVAAERHHKRLASREAGLEQGLLSMQGAGELRAQADLLLAYQTRVTPGATELRVPAFDDPAREVVLALDPRLPPHRLAAQWYERARRHEDGVEHARAQLATLRTRLAALAAVRERLAATAAGDRPGLDALAAELQALGAIAAERRAPSQTERRLTKITRGENLRRFTSSEGYLLLVGRTSEQNDRLSTRIARGGDVWFHVGLGRAGSHVVLRVPKGKTPSLESLLDGACLAVHFSKVRGAELVEVVYTDAKNVRKPKGLPPGKVVATQTRSLRVRADPERLQRLLQSAPDE